jgi:hypothetical protein
MPSEIAVLVNGTGGNYNLTTWHGSSDLSTLLSANVRRLTLNVCLQDGPIALLQAGFNLGKANINATSLIKKINAKILKLGFKQICHSFFPQLCPGYSNQPHAALDHIYQTAQGPDGQFVTLTVVKFYQRLMNGAPSKLSEITLSAFATSIFRSLTIVSYPPFVAITQGSPRYTILMLHINTSNCRSSLQQCRLPRTKFTKSKTFQFHMPYLTREGTASTLPIATSPHMTVNTIPDLPFIKQTCMNIDAADQVTNLHALDTLPFAIDFCRVMCTTPPLGKAPHASHYSDIIAEVEYLKQYVSGTVPGKPAPPALHSAKKPKPSDQPDKRVSFNAPIHDSAVEFSARSLCSVVTVGGSIEPDFDVDVSVLDNLSNNVPLSVCVLKPPPDNCGNAPPTFASTFEPICSTWHICGHRHPNVFYDDRGFPDQSHDLFDVVLHSIDGGTILCKCKHPALALDDIDPVFQSTYDETKHGAKLCSKLNLVHLDKPTQDLVYQLFQKYWSVFDDKCQFVPIKDYSCVIDTGSTQPISVKKIHCDPRGSPIMQKCIAFLAKLGHIRQVHDGEWLLKALLAPKPHQEHVQQIDDFVWQFCANYIPLNQITKPVAYPILCCNSAV